MIDDERRAAIARAEERNLKMLERVKQSGVSVRPAHIDKLAHPRGVFNRGRKQTI